MKLSAISAVVAVIVPLTATQSTGQPIIPSTLPACAQTCGILLQAQAACTAPPNAPPGGTYGLPCFCQSAFLGPLKSAAPSNICATCSTTDNAAIQSWFQGACKNGGTGGAGAAAGSNPQTTSTSSSSIATVVPAAATPTNSGATVNGQPAANTLNVAQKGW